MKVFRQLSAVIVMLSLYGSSCSREKLSEGSHSSSRLHTAEASPLTACSSSQSLFAQDVWAPVIADRCFGCHQAGGIADRLHSPFVLMDPHELDAVAHNFQVLRKVAADPSDKLIKKPSLQLPHYGGAVLAVDSPEYTVLQKFMLDARKPESPACPSISGEDVLQRSVGLSPAGVLRKASLRLAGRLPSPDETKVLAEKGSAGLDSLLDAYMNEPAFYDRLLETFNELLGTDSFARNGLATEALIPDTSILWFEPVAAWPTPDAYRRASVETNKALARAALMLIQHVVAQGRPFKEILTAPYAVLNPFSACALGVQANLKFAVPVNCKIEEAQSYDPADWREYALDPHQAGLLSDPIFLLRHPTTTTNRNRHRVNTVTTAFLGLDILKLSNSRLPPSTATGKNPTMSNRACTVCHAVMDPIAGIFQNWDADGRYKKVNWHKDMFGAGYHGEAMPDEHSSDALRWGAKRIADDPRFLTQTVRTMARFVLGLDLKQVPRGGTSDAADRWESFALQERNIQQWAAAFQAGHYNLKALVKAMVKDPVFVIADSRSDGSALEKLMTGEFLPARILSPESLDRKISKVLGQRWVDSKGSPFLNGAFFSFYGGVDSESIRQTPEDFTGLMSQVSLRMASDMACRIVPHLLSQDKSSSVAEARLRLLPSVSLNDTQEKNPVAVKKGLQVLHQALLGDELPEGSAPLKADLELWISIVQDVKKNPSKTALPPACSVKKQWDGIDLEPAQHLTKDPDGLVQAWMGVMTVMLADQKFLTE